MQWDISRETNKKNFIDNFSLSFRDDELSFFYTSLLSILLVTF